MEGWLTLVLSLPFVVALLWSGRWASRRFADFAELPAHFDFAGRATRMAPQRVMVWTLPVLFSLSLLFIAAVIALIPQDMQNGDPLPGVLVAGLAMLGAQMLILRLTDRWARAQR